MIRQTFATYILRHAMLLVLPGCQGFNPVIDTAGHFWAGKAHKNSFSPGFEYLEVEWQGRKAAMALGHRETKGAQVNEHWYSGQGEMIKLVNGRVVQVLGMTKEVRHALGTPPAWADLLTHRSPVVWSQTKEVMPLYRYGLQEYFLSRQSTPTASEKAIASEATAWVVEEVKSKTEKGMPWIYQQKFALVAGKVIYSEQCVAPEMCFKLKPLGVVVPK
jgi:Group 4 capsule polysaccharide lipoprotein gfcB, YjbF